MVLCDFKKATQNEPLLFFHEPSNPLLSFFNNQMMCGCDSVACTQYAKGEGWGVLWDGQKAGGLSLRVKRDERVGVWWLDGVDVMCCPTFSLCPIPFSLIIGISLLRAP